MLTEHRLDQFTRLKEAMARVPRATLGSFPTPLVRASRLAKAHGAPQLFIKRDDCSGPALGGNKIRMLEYVLADALTTQCSLVIASPIYAGNYCRQLAGSCAALGLDCHIIAPRPDIGTASGRHQMMSLTAARLFGARVSVAGSYEEARRKADTSERRSSRAGHRVYRLLIDYETLDPDERRVNALHALGYCGMFVELHDQLLAMDVRATRLWVCSGGATQAGLVLANALTGGVFEITGVAPPGINHTQSLKDDIARIARDAACILDEASSVEPFDVVNIAPPRARKEGHIPDRTVAAIRSVARTEGILLDPMYAGPAMAQLLRHVHTEDTPAWSTGVFVHTGGITGLFSSRNALQDLL